MRDAEHLLIYHDLVAGIVAAMEARDPYTASHSMRVAELTQRLCRVLPLGTDTAEIIHIAAHFHDIGKIGVEDAVLRKQGPLNESEWQKMRLHPVIGSDILRRVDCFDEIAGIVRSHHERWDGGGYPDGLADAQIPYGARVIAVADSIDAMCSYRSYRKGLSAEQCKKEIACNAGVRYDPQIAAAAVAHWEELLGGFYGASITHSSLSFSFVG